MKFAHLIAILALVSTTLADDDEKRPINERLRDAQTAVSGRFSSFERMLTQMADILGFEDPERAELLRRAVSEGQEDNISEMLDQIAKDLGTENFGNATERQRKVTASLENLLKLLQSEDRRSSVEKERERLNALLKGFRDAINRQRAAKARTQNSRNPADASPDQQRANKKAEELLAEIEKHDRRKNAEDSDSKSKSGESDPKDSQGQGSDSKEAKDGKEGESSDNETGDNESGDNKDAGVKEPGDDKKPGDEKEASGEKPGDKDGEPKDPSEKPDSDTDDADKQNGGKEKQDAGSKKPESQQQNSDQKKSQGDSPESSGESGEQKEQGEKTPGREQLETARNLMMEALDQLKKQDKEEAVDKQEKAIAELQKSAEEIEKLLKQLREEEKEMILATLEARFQRLLSLQTQVYESTLDLSQTDRADWSDNAITVCRELAGQQNDAAKECSFTVSLLREDGTSVTILLAVEDIERDMQAVARRLQQTNAGLLTQSIETDVIEALKELIEITQREMQEMKEQDPDQQQQQQGQSQQMQKPPLVQLLQEIRMLRSLQVRINKRIQRVHGLMEEAGPDDLVDLENQQAELAVRQERLRESAIELNRQLEQQR